MQAHVVCVKNKDPYLPGRAYLDSSGHQVKDITKAHKLSLKEKAELERVLSSGIKGVTFVEYQEIKVNSIY